MRATLPAMSPTVGLSWAMVMRSMNGALAVSGDVRRCRAVSDGDRLGQAEDLAKIGQIGFVVAQRLARRVRDLGHGLAVGVGELHHDVDGLQPHVVGQPRADAEAQLYAVGKALVQGQGKTLCND